MLQAEPRSVWSLPSTKHIYGALWTPDRQTEEINRPDTSSAASGSDAQTNAPAAASSASEDPDLDNHMGSKWEVPDWM